MIWARSTNPSVARLRYNKVFADEETRDFMLVSIVLSESSWRSFEQSALSIVPQVKRIINLA